MTLKDKLEIGLKEDAPYRKDNLPDFQVRGDEVETGPGRSPLVVEALKDPATPAAGDVARARGEAEAAAAEAMTNEGDPNDENDENEAG